MSENRQRMSAREGIVTVGDRYVADGYEQAVERIGEPASTGEDAAARDFYLSGFDDAVLYVVQRIRDEVIRPGERRANVSGLAVTMVDVHDALRALSAELIVDAVRR
jgi:hypothetical protein